MYINNLITGTMTLGGGGSSGHPETRVKYTAESGLPDATFNIEGILNRASIDNISYIEEVDIGNTVTSIGPEAFRGCSGLTDMAIPGSVASIGYSAFQHCSGLTSVTFQGKTLAQVQEMSKYPWDIEDTSIINVA